jgi:uncharacterized RDD family membrane protein YckC
MSTERIKYNEASFVIRLIALGIDVVIGIFIAIFSQFGAQLEWDLIWSSLLGIETMPQELIFVWFILFFPAYHILCSSLTNGQTVGKMIFGIRVMTDSYESTKREFKLHFKRFFFIKGGTKVVKETDPTVAGLA